MHWSAVWAKFWDENIGTVGVSALFAILGGGMLMWIGAEPLSRGRALMIFSASQVVNAAATIFVHGYLQWSPFVAPVVGTVCGLVALPAIWTVVKMGRQVEGHADDIANKAIDKVTK
jgi:hypothetical protein